MNPLRMRRKESLVPTFRPRYLSLAPLELAGLVLLYAMAHFLENVVLSPAILSGDIALPSFSAFRCEITEKTLPP
jgi:hypothetical protein